MHIWTYSLTIMSASFFIVWYCNRSARHFKAHRYSIISDLFICIENILDIRVRERERHGVQLNLLAVYSQLKGRKRRRQEIAKYREGWETRQVWTKRWKWNFEMLLLRAYKKKTLFWLFVTIWQIFLKVSSFCAPWQAKPAHLRYNLKANAVD